MKRQCENFFHLLESLHDLQHYYHNTLVPKYQYRNGKLNEIQNWSLRADYQDEVYNLIKSDLLAERNRLHTPLSTPVYSARSAPCEAAREREWEVIPASRLLSAFTDKADESIPSSQCRIKPYKWIMAICLITAWMQIY